MICHLAKTFERSMAQFPIMCPGTIGYLGNPRWLYENVFLSLNAAGCRNGDTHSIQLTFQVSCKLCGKAGADVADINQAVVSACSKQQACDATGNQDGWLVADYNEAFAVRAFDLQPVGRPARPIGADCGSPGE